MNLVLATSSIEDGNMALDWGPESEVQENRKRFLEKNGLSAAECAFMDLEHGANIAVLGEGDKGKHFAADALMTRASGPSAQASVALFLMTADCFPIAYHDPSKDALALAHLGWRSADAGLAGKVVERMTKEYGSDPNDILVFVGPGIHAESYLVENPSQKNDIRWAPFLEEVMGKTRVDLIGFILASLMDAGIPRERISISPENTAVSAGFFSHFRAARTGEPEGRFATVAVLR